MPADAELHATLDCELPGEVAVGAGTAVFVCGWCFSPAARIASLALALGDLPPQPVAAARMPRLDPFRALDGEPASYRSGFWGLVEIPRRPAQPRAELTLHARLDDGGSAQATLGTVACRDVPVRPGIDDAPEIVVAMAVHEPPPALLRRQLESIRAQTVTDWACVIADDHSSEAGRRTLREAVGDDPRFTVSHATRRLGFYANFERALSLVPRGARFVALADQDDAWHPDKLATLRAAIGDAPLAFSDARVVDATGAVVADSWWTRREPNHDDPFALLVANSVTGAASLVRGDVLDVALPFPPGQFAHFHDHWLGLVARALGELVYVDRPLYDYVQHGEASLGHAGANRMETFAQRLAGAGELRARVAQWRLHYFADVWRLRTLVAVLRLRLGGRMSPDVDCALGRLDAAERSLPALAALAARGARDMARERPRTLAAEWMLAYALGWRRLLAASARERPQRRLRLDALPPPTLRAEPGRRGLDPAAREVADKIAPLRWAVSDDAPERVNLLIPTIDLRHLFAGYIGKFNLAARLAAHGTQVRIVTVDPVGALPPDHRRRVEAYAGLAGLWDRVELVFGREAATRIEVSPRDRFVATTWWTAHIAHAALASTSDGSDRERERFLYLIQEYEPFTFAMGSWAALAAESYTFPHAALFSSELLRGYFRAHAIGVYADGTEAGDALSRAFENAISDVAPPTLSELDRPTRRLLFYARPEEHAARNMFELGMLALARAVESGALRGGWELHGIGTVRGARRLSLGDATLELLPRTDQRSYAELLRAHDVGLALMYTPHPSLVPIEMAAAGLVTVTNSFENKTPEALAGISANLVCAEPTVTGVADALAAAAARVDAHDARVQGSDVRWSRSWESSFPRDLLDWALAAI